MRELRNGSPQKRKHGSKCSGSTHNTGKGYSLSDEEVDNGVLAIGAPVFDSTGRLWRFGLAGLKFTINEKELSRMISLSVECARSNR